MNRRVTRAAFLPTASTIALAAFCISTANAQDAANAPATQVESVIVTGSRLSSSFAAPTPVTAINTDQLAQVTSNNISEALVQLPSLVGSLNTTNAGSGSPSAGTNGETLLNLRGLGANRTLVLLDGARMPVSNLTGTTDVNGIPQVLLSRVDVVTGGASAAYGSDAVAGVVNFILNTHFDGFKGSISGGVTQYGDAVTSRIQGAYGTSFLGGRARVVASVDVFQQDGITYKVPNGRNWFDHPEAAYGNPVAGAKPTTIQVPNAVSDIGTAGGLITGVQGCATAACKAVILTTQFGPGGAFAPYSNGVNAGSGWTSGGDGFPGENGLTPEQHRQSVFAHAEYDFNDYVTGFAEFMYNKSHTDLIAQPPFEVGTKYQFTIFPNNAYLPANLAAFFAANPTATSISVGRYMNDSTIKPTDNDDSIGVMRFRGGVKGNINDRWTFDASLAYSRSYQNLHVENTINRNLYAAADAVTNSSGQIVCRSTLSGLDPGCVPVNLFGPNSVSQAASNFIEGDNIGDTTFHQTAFDANIRGDLGDDFQLGAGPISVAFGMAYRRDDARRWVDALSATTVSCAGLRGCPTALNNLYGGYQLYNPGPINGSIGVTEGYSELGIPILKDLPFIKSFAIDLAGRMADYTQSGVNYSWKAGANWSVTDDLRLRATTSQDVRAPNITELFSLGQASTGQALYPASNPTFSGSPTNLGQQVLSPGNPALKPELAHTTTLGTVYSPSWLPGLQASVDWYGIDVGGAITTVSAQQTVNNCFLGIQTYCNLISVNGVPVTTTVGITALSPALVVKQEVQNLAKVTTSGYDLELDYTTEVLGGNLTTRALANIPVTSFNSSNTPGTRILDRYGDNNYTLSALFDTPDYSVYAQERVIGNGHMDPNLIEGQTISMNNVPYIFYTDATLTYKFNSYFDTSEELYLNITNLFNQAPPITVTTAGNWLHPTDYSVYDVLGRRFTIGLRIKS